MRPDRRRPLSSGQGPAAGALPWGELQCGRAPAGCHGATRDLADLNGLFGCLSCTLAFLRRCRFIPLIYRHYLCLETFVKLFLAPPPHPRDTKTPRILACSHKSQLPIPHEMEGWQQGSTSRCEVWGTRGIQASFTPPRTAEVKEYAGIYQFGLLFSDGI